MRKLITLLALLLAFSFSLVAQEAEQDNITQNPEVEVPAEQPQPETDDEFILSFIIFNKWGELYFAKYIWVISKHCSNVSLGMVCHKIFWI